MDISLGFLISVEILFLDMRPISYRAWDKKNRRMCSVWTISWKTWHDKEIINYVTVEGNDGTYDLLEHEVELLQYTGFKDDNGKEICEGDIVEQISKPGYPEEDSEENVLLVVEWANSFPGFNLRTIERKHEHLDSIFSIHSIMKIVGNRYENQDLMEIKETKNERFHFPN